MNRVTRTCIADKSKPPVPASNYTLLHEAAHAEDAGIGFMDKKKGNPEFAAWKDESPATIAPIAAAHLRFDKDYILAHLKDPAVVLLDARSPDEYTGRTKRAARVGHIPGAVNYNWTDAMDQSRFLRLKDAQELKRALEGLGVTPDKEVITYCQTHHRSAHTYVVLKSLGYPKVKAYPGSWSEWGARDDTAVVKG